MFRHRPRCFGRLWKGFIENLRYWRGPVQNLHCVGACIKLVCIEVSYKTCIAFPCKTCLAYRSRIKPALRIILALCLSFKTGQKYGLSIYAIHRMLWLHVFDIRDVLHVRCPSCAACLIPEMCCMNR